MFTEKKKSMFYGCNEGSPEQIKPEDVPEFLN